jgi:tetratricopeptide (TPR) repeat protein
VQRGSKRHRTIPGTVAGERHGLALALLACLAFLVYFNSIQNGLVQDSSLLFRDPRITAASLENVKLIFQHTYWWPTGETGLYRPVVSLSYLLNYAVDAYHPAGYHLLNLLLHAANACLVYRLAFLLMGGVWPAFFTAAVWSLHPLGVEAVANVIGRAEELAALSVLAALLLYIRSTAEKGRRRLPWLAAAMGVAAVGVFSKENAVVVVGAVVLYDLTYRLRPLRANLVRTAAGYAAFAPPLVAMWLARSAVFSHSAPPEFPFLDNPMLGADFLTARLTAIKVLGKYLGLLAWPGALSCDRSYNQIPLAGWRDWEVLVTMAVIAGLLAVAARCYSRQKAAFFFMAFSALALLPASNLVVRIGTIMAERFLYLPAVGFAASLVVAVYGLSRRLRWKPAVAPALLCAVAAAFGVRTCLRNRDWRDEETLWRSTVAVSPQSFKAHMALANALFAKGAAGIDEAIAEMEKAAAIVERVPDHLNSTIVPYALGAAYLAKGDLAAHPERLVWYQKARISLSRAAAIDREYNAAVRRKRLAQGKHPDRIPPTGLPDLYKQLGRAHLELGDPNYALDALFYARRLAPQDPDVYRRIAGAYSAAGKTEKIAPALLTALILDDSIQSIDEVLGVYGKLAPQGCAAMWKEGRRILNPNCPPVRRDFCAAYRELAATYREAALDEMANETGAIARQQYGCDPEQAGR